MNLKWMIIGGVLVILLVAFGRNPVEEMRERRAERLEGKDPLVYSIEEHNKERSGFGGGFNPSALPSAQSRGGFQPGSPVYNPNKPFLNRQPAQPQPEVLPPSPRPSPQNNYYPPAPGSQGSFNNAPVKADSPFMLRDGRKLSFHGAKAYAQNAKGEMVPLEDGSYPIFGGRASLVIKNGAKVGIVPNMVN